MEQKPVLDVNEVPKPEMVIFEYTTFVRDVWINSACSVFNRIESISSINIKWIRTLAFLLITKGQVPAYLGSSFAFIAPIITAKTAGNGSSNAWWFASRACVHLNLTGIKKSGSEWIMKLLANRSYR